MMSIIKQPDALTSDELNFLGSNNIYALMTAYAHSERVIESVLAYEPKLKYFLINMETLSESLVQQILFSYDSNENPGVGASLKSFHEKVPPMTQLLKRTDLDMLFFEELINTSQNKKLRTMLLRHKSLSPDFLHQMLIDNISEEDRESILQNPSTPFPALMDALYLSDNYSLFSVLKNPSLTEYQYDELIECIFGAGGHSVDDLDPNIFRAESTPGWILHKLASTPNTVAKCLAAGHKNTYLEDLNLLADEIISGDMTSMHTGYLFENLIQNPSTPSGTLAKIISKYPESGMAHYAGSSMNLNDELFKVLLSQYRDEENLDLVPYHVMQRVLASNKKLTPGMLKALGRPETLYNVQLMLSHESCTEEISEWILTEMTATNESWIETAYWLKHEHLFSHFSLEEPEELIKALLVNPNTPSTLLAEIVYEHQNTLLASISIKLGGYESVLTELDDRAPFSEHANPNQVIDFWLSNRSNDLRLLSPTEIV